MILLGIAIALHTASVVSQSFGEDIVLFHLPIGSGTITYLVLRRTALANVLSVFLMVAFTLFSRYEHFNTMLVVKSATQRQVHCEVEHALPFQSVTRALLCVEMRRAQIQEAKGSAAFENSPSEGAGLLAWWRWVQQGTAPSRQRLQEDRLLEVEHAWRVMYALCSAFGKWSQDRQALREDRAMEWRVTRARGRWDRMREGLVRLWRDEGTRGRLGLGLTLLAGMVYATGAGQPSNNSLERSIGTWILGTAALVCASGGGFDGHVVRVVLLKPQTMLALAWLAVVSITDMIVYLDYATLYLHLRSGAVTKYMIEKGILHILVVECICFILILPAGRMEFPHKATLFGSMVALFSIGFFISHLSALIGYDERVPERVIIQFATNSAMTVDSLRRAATLFLLTYLSKVTHANLSSAICGVLALGCSCRRHHARTRRTAAPKERRADAESPAHSERQAPPSGAAWVDFQCPQLAVVVPRWNEVDNYVVEVARMLRTRLGSRQGGRWPDALGEELDRHRADLDVLEVEESAVVGGGRERSRAFML